jgi:hypothetical protein
VSRDMSKDLTIVVTGLGKITLPNLNDLLENWMFGDQDEREIRIIVPVLSKMGTGLKEFCKWGINIGFDFTIVQAGDAGMTKEITSLPEKCFVRVDNDRDALQCAMDFLHEDHDNGNETAFIMLYDETSTYKQGDAHLSDREIIGEAKNYTWLTTLNLCQGLTDFFEGYESTDDRIQREAKEAEFAEEQAKLKAAEPKPAKKAAAPRKRAAKKAVAPEPTPVLEEPEKPLQEPSEPIAKGWGDYQGNCIHYFVWADDDMGNEGSVCTNCGLEEPSEPIFERPKLPIEKLVEQRVATELSATSSLKPVAKEIWDDIVAAKSMTDLSATAMLKHAKAVQAMGQAFTDVIGTLVELMEEKSV